MTIFRGKLSNSAASRNSCLKKFIIFFMKFDENELYDRIVEPDLIQLFSSQVFYLKLFRIPTFCFKLSILKYKKLEFSNNLIVDMVYTKVLTLVAICKFVVENVLFKL